MDNLHINVEEEEVNFSWRNFKGFHCCANAVTASGQLDRQGDSYVRVSDS